MRNYAQAYELAEAGVAEVLDHESGKPRRVAFRHRDNGDVSAKVYETDIVTWHPDGSVTVSTGGYPTRATFDGIAAALNISRARVGMVKRVPYVNGHDLTFGSVTLPAEEVQ